ncbi:hypothetical protein L1987_04732 [Smallanthus sonchifolius]|uniref:Uncharacterized protein n=1 Tax=Smallanthus sonchifolius TaxID=185202 RepID=A0ACB9JTF6_9ASTR|nr:hypothetical protein L1987_04732 [Smallanthus sonchifolius]
MTASTTSVSLHPSHLYSRRVARDLVSTDYAIGASVISTINLTPSTPQQNQLHLNADRSIHALHLIQDQHLRYLFFKINTIQRFPIHVVRVAGIFFNMALKVKFENHPNSTQMKVRCEKSATYIQCVPQLLLGTICPVGATSSNITAYQ